MKTLAWCFAGSTLTGIQSALTQDTSGFTARSLLIAAALFGKRESLRAASHDAARPQRADRNRARISRCVPRKRWGFVQQARNGLDLAFRRCPPHLGPQSRTRVAGQDRKKDHPYRRPRVTLPPSAPSLYRK